ncbi:MAG: aminotransferase class I/II-fold pyridoxal phosphate-dependent enzyme, partial [Actinomycetota bacterium]
ACYLTPGRRVLIAGPTFGEYARASALYGAEPIRLNAYENREIPDVAPLLDAIHNLKPTLVWLCHPNNPTGHAWTASQLETVANACLRNDALLAIDAAYLEVSSVASEALPAGALTLWSLTKSFCIPGLRVGYATGPREVAAHLNRVAAPWQASGPSQEAALWARSDEGRSFLGRTVPELLATGQALRRKLQEVGYQTHSGVTPFFLIEVGDAAAFKDAAREHGFRVRNASSFGLPRHVRLAPQQEQANASLVAWMSRRRHG